MVAGGVAAIAALSFGATVLSCGSTFSVGVEQSQLLQTGLVALNAEQAEALVFREAIIVIAAAVVVVVWLVLLMVRRILRGGHRLGCLQRAKRGWAQRSNKLQVADVCVDWPRFSEGLAIQFSLRLCAIDVYGVIHAETWIGGVLLKRLLLMSDGSIMVIMACFHSIRRRSEGKDPKISVDVQTT